MLNPFKKLVLVAGLCALPFTASHAQFNVSITVAPPELIAYEQPPCPVDGYLWTPGYWAYGEDDYYWVPGVWVAPPRVGFLWTPGYWGFADGFYAFHTGYWGPTVGFYGGVDYGYGYGGRGYYGGGWQGNVFRYNTAVTRVNATVIHNTYNDRTVIRENNSRVSFNGQGGVNARPTADERRAASAPHVGATGEQMARRQAAIHDRGASAATRLGRPAAGANAQARGPGANPQARPEEAQGGFHRNRADREPGRQAQSVPEERPGAARQAARREQGEEAGRQAAAQQAERRQARQQARQQAEAPQRQFRQAQPQERPRQQAQAERHQPRQAQAEGQGHPHDKKSEKQERH